MININVIIIFFFFFKQKTAYEIKECDWSSDVSLPIFFTLPLISSPSLSVIPALLKLVPSCSRRRPESGLFNKFRMSRTLSGQEKNKKRQIIHGLLRVCVKIAKR